jgi:hypothetical protein
MSARAIGFSGDSLVVSRIMHEVIRALGVVGFRIERARQRRSECTNYERQLLAVETGITDEFFAAVMKQQSDTTIYDQDFLKKPNSRLPPHTWCDAAVRRTQELSSR